MKRKTVEIEIAGEFADLPVASLSELKMTKSQLKKGIGIRILGDKIR